MSVVINLSTFNISSKLRGLQEFEIQIVLNGLSTCMNMIEFLQKL